MCMYVHVQVGPDFPLALDCYMALSVPYAIRLGHALAPHGLKWLEEFLPPDDYEGYAEVPSPTPPPWPPPSPPHSNTPSFYPPP